MLSGEREQRPCQPGLHEQHGVAICRSWTGTEYGTFLGDYSGLAVSGTTAYPIWSDTRNQEFFQCPSHPNPLGLCRVTNGNVPGFDEDVFTTTGLTLP
jgi:hypothetical protein